MILPAECDASVRMTLPSTDSLRRCRRESRTRHSLTYVIDYWRCRLPAILWPGVQQLQPALNAKRLHLHTTNMRM